MHLQYEKQEEVVHDILVNGSSIFADQKVSVNSVHHQACNLVPDVLKITAKSEDDVIEMFEHVSKPILGVQWHPECIADTDFSKKIMQWLLVF